jgi:hypothetical protein
VQVSSRSRAEAARAPVRELKPVGAETPEVRSVSRDDARAAAQGKKKPGEASEGKDDVELDGEGFGDAAFIEEREDTDVSEIIGDDIETEKGT